MISTCIRSYPSRQEECSCQLDPENKSLEQTEDVINTFYYDVKTFILYYKKINAEEAAMKDWLKLWY